MSTKSTKLIQFTLFLSLTNKLDLSISERSYTVSQTHVNQVRVLKAIYYYYLYITSSDLVLRRILCIYLWSGGWVLRKFIVPLKSCFNLHSFPQ